MKTPARSQAWVVKTHRGAIIPRYYQSFSEARYYAGFAVDRIAKVEIREVPRRRKS